MKREIDALQIAAARASPTVVQERAAGLADAVHRPSAELRRAATVGRDGRGP